MCHHQHHRHRHQRRRHDHDHRRRRHHCAWMDRRPDDDYEDIDELHGIHKLILRRTQRTLFKIHRQRSPSYMYAKGSSNASDERF